MTPAASDDVTLDEIKTITPVDASNENAADDPNLFLLQSGVIARLEKELMHQTGAVSLTPREKKVLTAKFFATGLGLQAGIPYLSAARGLTASPGFGWFLGGCIVVSNAALVTWSLLDLVDNLAEDLRAEEVRKTGCKRIIGISQWCSAFVLGIASALPSTYVGYTYNNESLYWGGILFIADSSINTYAISRALTRFNLQCCRPIDLLKTRYVDNLENGIYIFISLTDQHRFELLQKCGINLTDESSFNGKAHFILYEIGLLPRLLPKNKYLQLRRGTTLATDVFGVLLPISWMVVALKLSFNGSKLIYDNPYFNGFIAVFAVSPSTFLEMILSKQVYINVAKFIASLLAKTPLKSKSSIIFPGISLAANAFMLFIATFSFGARATLTFDNFDNTPATILATFIILTTITYKSFSMPELIDKILVFFAKRHHELTNVTVIKMLEVLTRFKAMLGKSSDSEFIGFLKESDSTQVAQLLDVNKDLIEHCKNVEVTHPHRTHHSLPFFKNSGFERGNVAPRAEVKMEVHNDPPPPRKSRCPAQCRFM